MDDEVPHGIGKVPAEADTGHRTKDTGMQPARVGYRPSQTAVGFQICHGFQRRSVPDT